MDRRRRFGYGVVEAVVDETLAETIEGDASIKMVRVLVLVFPQVSVAT